MISSKFALSSFLGFELLYGLNFILIFPLILSVITSCKQENIVETILNMIMNYEGESDCLILEVISTEVFRGWRMSLTFLARGGGVLCTYLC